MSVAITSNRSLRPFNTFGIEERFGFNKTTAKTFVTDMIKTAALARIATGTEAG